MGGPGPEAVAVGVGVESLRPHVELGVAPLDWLTLRMDATLERTAPRAGAQVDFAAGVARDLLYVHIYASGHLRPLFTTEVLSGMDAHTGIGIVGLFGALVFGVEGGLALGLRLQSAGVDPEAIDQQGGLFQVQRLRLAYDLWERVELQARAQFAFPISDLRLDRDEENFVRIWDARFGGLLLVRF